MRTYTKFLVAALACGAALAGQATAQETKPGVVIWGRVFADATYKSVKDDATGIKTTDSGTGIDVKRFYLGATDTFDNNWSAAITLDIGDKGNTVKCTGAGVSCSGGDNKRYDVFVKNAYVQYKVSDAAIFRLGAATLPWIGYEEENMWNLRYVEVPSNDRAGIGYSADWGFHFLGKAAGGVVNYALSATNGRGYSDTTRSKRVDFEGRLGFTPIKGFNVAIGGYSGKRGLDTEPQTTTGSSPALNTVTRINLLASYSTSKFGICGQWFSAKNWNNVTTVLEDKTDGYAAWARYEFTPEYMLFGRVDSVKPHKDLFPDVKDVYYNIGVQRKFSKTISGAIVYKGGKVDNSSTLGTTTDYVAYNAGNYTANSYDPHSQVKYSEIGVYTLFNF